MQKTESEHIKTNELADTYLHCRIRKTTKARLKALAMTKGVSMSQYISGLIWDQKL